jgi:sugar phosphate isomerase/epimerase
MTVHPILKLFAYASLAALAVAQSVPPVPGFPIGRCVRVLGVTAPEDAKTAGFEYLELALQDLLPLSDEEFDGIVTRLQAIGLPAISGYGFLPGDLPMVGPAVDWARVDEHLRRGLDRAKRLGLSMVVYGNLNNRSRRAPDGFPAAQARAQLVEFGRRAARESERRGITVLIEPLLPNATNTINTVAEALALVEEVNHPNFQMLVDFSFMTIGKEDFGILRRAATHIRQVEISNPNGRMYPKLPSEADYAGFFRALKYGGYRGGFSIHGAPTDFFIDAPRAIAMLRTVAAPVFAGKN